MSAPTACMGSDALRPGSSTAASRASSRARRAITPIRSPTSRSGRAAPAKASSGNRSTRRAPARRRCCSWSRTTATRSRCRWRCRPPAATSRVSSASFPGLLVSRCDGTDYLASYRHAGGSDRLRPRRQGPGARPRHGHASVLALPLRRRALVQDARRTRGRGAARPAGAHAPAADRRGHCHRGRTGRDAGGRRARGQRSRRLGARSAEARPVDRGALRLLARRRSLVVALRGRAAHRGRARHDGGRAQPDAEGRNGARRAHRRLRAGRRGRQPPRGARDAGADRQGRCVPRHARPAAPVWRAPRLQLAAGRGQHHRPRGRHGAARAQAGRRDPVLRLHLAGLHADSRRARR